MNQCLNPDCLAVNLETHRFCQKCGQKLWLKDRYQALKLIGQGGFGKTFLAIDHDKPSKPQCVIKQFFPQGQGTDGLQKAAELFAEEAKRLDELGKHPQIPELLAYFIHEDKRQYLVQEYIAGQNLEQELKSQGNFNQDKIRALLSDLLPVLDFIHQRQVIHRDIKPENIIRRAQDNKLVLVDFGAAKAVTPVNRSVTGTMIGSAEYVAPEQMNGKAVNASDLYSLGVTCLYLLTGISPFDLFDVGEHEWIWRDYLVDNSASDDLGNILDKLVIFGTKRRYQSVEEVLADLGVSSNPPRVTTIQSSSQPPVSLSPIPSLEFLEQKRQTSLFTQLETYLKKGQWREADEETTRLMLLIAGRLDVESIQQFPCEEFRTIDKLWVDYSKGKFGFSVQKKVWIACGGVPGKYDYKVYYKFAEQVGWRRRRSGDWLRYDGLTFLLEGSNPAHLPAFCWRFGGHTGGSGFLWQGVVLFSRAATCNL